MYNFVRANITLIDSCFSPFERHGLRIDETPQAKQLISLAKKTLGFDNAISDINAFMEVVHVWLEVRKAMMERSKLRMAAEPRPPEYGAK